jgi:plasmid stabilization system protein ParE
MSRRVVYLPEVTRDYADAIAYYEALSPMAALRFDEAYSRAEAEVESGLVTHQRAFEYYHRVFVGNYPYNLYYRLDGTTAVIAGILYARFPPEQIEEALRQRG